MTRSVATVVRAVVVLGLVPLALLSIGSAREGEASTAMDARFVGTWDLVSFVSYRESGETIENDYVARIIYDEQGNMIAVGMPRDLPQRARNADGSQPRGGFAYYSTTELHPDQGYIVHNVIASPMRPEWPGTGLVRFYEFEDDLMRLSLREGDSPTGRVTGTLTWRRIQ